MKIVLEYVQVNDLTGYEEEIGHLKYYLQASLEYFVRCVESGDDSVEDSEAGIIQLLFAAIDPVKSSGFYPVIATCDYTADKVKVVIEL